VPKPPDGKIAFDSFVSAFPFDTNAFHFRFQAPSPDGSHSFIWSDFDPAIGGDIPDYGGRIFCKALRLGGRARAAPRAKPAPNLKSPAARTCFAKPSPKPAGGNVFDAPSPSSKPTDEVYDPFDISTPTQPMQPGGSVGQPADLKGSKLNDVLIRRIEMWKTKDGKEPGGTGIRNLLMSLHQIMWPDSKWKEVPLSQLITPQAVKKFYVKGIRETHPDRVSNLPAETRLIAEKIFETLNNAWKEHETKELGKK